MCEEANVNTNTQEYAVVRLFSTSMQSGYVSIEYNSYFNSIKDRQCSKPKVVPIDSDYLVVIIGVSS